MWHVWASQRHAAALLVSSHTSGSDRLVSPEEVGCEEQLGGLSFPRQRNQAGSSLTVATCLHPQAFWGSQGRDPALHKLTRQPTHWGWQPSLVPQVP